MMDKQRYLKSKEEQIVQRDADIKEQRQALQREIKGVYSWIVKHINSKTISEQEEESDEENQNADENMNQSTSAFIDPIIMKEFQKLRTLLIN